MEECQKWINSKIRWGSGTRYHLSFVIPRPWVPGPTQRPLISALNSPLYGTASNTTIWPVQMAHLCALTQLLSYGALGFTGTLKNTWGVARRALETKVPGNPVLKCLSFFRAVGACTSSQGELLFLIFWIWTIFKVFIEYITVSFLFWFGGCKACGIFAPWPGIKPTLPALGGRALTLGWPRRSWELPLGGDKMSQEMSRFRFSFWWRYLWFSGPLLARQCSCPTQLELHPLDY